MAVASEPERLLASERDGIPLSAGCAEADAAAVDRLRTDLGLSDAEMVRLLDLVPRTQPDRDIFAGYDPDAAIEGLRALDEAFAGVDREKLLRDLRAQRAQDSRGRPA